MPKTSHRSAHSCNHFLDTRRQSLVTTGHFVTFEEFPVRADFSSPIPRLLTVVSRTRRGDDGGSCCVNHLLRLVYGSASSGADRSSHGRSLCTGGVAVKPLKERCAVAGRETSRLRTALVMTTLNWDSSTAELRDSTDTWLAGPTVDDCPHQAYSEEAFRYFLGLERKRAERSGRALLLLLVGLTPDSGGDPSVPSGVSTKLFSGLSQCVRDVDFIGWYRHGRVAGAVLTQGAESPALEASEQIGQRVIELLGKRLPASIVSRLQIRVLQARQTVQS